MPEHHHCQKKDYAATNPRTLFLSCNLPLAMGNVFPKQEQTTPTGERRMLALIEADIAAMEAQEADYLRRIKELQHLRAQNTIAMDYAKGARDRFLASQVTTEPTQTNTTPADVLRDNAALVEAIAAGPLGDANVIADAIQPPADDTEPAAPDSDLERARRHQRERRNQRDREKRAAAKATTAAATESTPPLT
jgi:hypothetical protein